MKKEEIKSVEDALSFIADLEEIQNNKTIEIDGLNAKMKEMDTSIKKITEENKEVLSWCKEKKVNSHMNIQVRPYEKADIAEAISVWNEVVLRFKLRNSFSHKFI